MKGVIRNHFKRLTQGKTLADPSTWRLLLSSFYECCSCFQVWGRRAWPSCRTRSGGEMGGDCQEGGRYVEISQCEAYLSGEKHKSPFTDNFEECGGIFTLISGIGLERCTFPVSLPVRLKWCESIALIKHALHTALAHCSRPRKSANSPRCNFSKAKNRLSYPTIESDDGLSHATYFSTKILNRGRSMVSHTRSSNMLLLLRKLLQALLNTNGQHRRR